MKWVTEKPVKLAEKHSNKAGVCISCMCYSFQAQYVKG